MKYNPEGPKAEPIRNLFSNIADTYDKANDAITFGMAHSWRRKLVKMSDAKLGDSVLDCATGTGDLAIEFKKIVGDGRVVGSDFCKEMLDEAPAKAKSHNLDIQFDIEDVTQLSYQANSFDISTIAYGIRNVENPEQGLKELARVVKPGGKVLILETGEITTPVMKQLIGVYFKHIVPRVGGWVSGNREAYEYLNQSSGNFPCKDKFVALMESTNAFSNIEYKSLMGGASYIYKATVK